MFSVLMKTFAVFFCLQRRKRRTSLLFHELNCLCFEIYLTAVCCSCVGSLLCFIIPSCVHNRDQGDTDAYRVVVAVFSLLYLIKVQFHCSHEVVFSLFCFLSLLCYTRRCVSTAVFYTEVCSHRRPRGLWPTPAEAADDSPTNLSCNI